MRIRICISSMSAIALIKERLSATQVQIAAITGRNQATVSRWERGESSPSLDDLAKIRAEFDRKGVPWTDDILFSADDKNGCHSPEQ